MSKDTYSTLGDSKEVEIKTSVDGRTFRTIIWVVVVNDALFIRSFLGDRGNWYQRSLANPVVTLAVGNDRAEFTVESVTDNTIIEAVSEAFIAKYRPGRSRDAMVAPNVLHTTLRLIPA